MRTRKRDMGRQEEQPDRPSPFPERRKVQAGQRFGRLTVMEKTDERERGYVVWKCRCDCGNSLSIDSRRLTRGTVKDCGCVPRTTTHRGNIAEDLTGRRFGCLTVLRRTENKNGRTCWVCRCDCGNGKEVTAHDLKAGKVKTCGQHPHMNGRKHIDLSGRRFGRLTALQISEKRDYKGSVYWFCRCDCGEETLVTVDALTSGHCQSCGCLKSENQQNISKALHIVDGTCVEMLEKRKHRRDNTSGFRGVNQLKNGKYRVNIGFKGERYHIGSFERYEDAVNARLEAEELEDWVLDDGATEHLLHKTPVMLEAHTEYAQMNLF